MTLHSGSVAALVQAWLSLCTRRRPWIQPNSPRPHLPHVWQWMAHTEEPSFCVLEGVQKSCVISRFQIFSLHCTTLTVFHQQCFMAQASLLFLFWSLSIGFLAAAQPSNLQLKLFFTQLKLRLAQYNHYWAVLHLWSCELPATQAVDSQKPVFWFHYYFGSTRSLSVIFPQFVSTFCWLLSNT